MTLLEDEIRNNYARFHADWTAQAPLNWNALRDREDYYESYRRICVIHTWKNEIILRRLSQESAAFFLEAHNDLLFSHVQASFGAWRSALQTLRSFIENALEALYFKDHPIELDLWSTGRFRIGFSELHAYFKKHPRCNQLNHTITGLDALSREYATLSKATHASAKNFRMTDDVSSVLLWSIDAVKCRMWSTRERHVVESVCLLMVCLFSDELHGTKKTALREMLSFVFSKHKRELVKRNLQVTIPVP